jgi:hypothetical protein
MRCQPHAAHDSDYASLVRPRLLWDQLITFHTYMIDHDVTSIYMEYSSTADFSKLELGVTDTVPRA